jgi:hypothetical protein
MIVQIVDGISVAVLKAEGYAPVPGNFNGSVPLELAFKLMEIIAGNVHIVDTPGGVQTIKPPPQSCRVARLYAPCRAFMEEVLKALVLKALYHGQA